jgi:imidazolonepropionase-like amidohydrolase
MRIRVPGAPWRSLAALLLALPALAACGRTAALEVGAAGALAGAQEVVAFVGVNVIPMDRERVLENQTVLVADGRIAQVGPEAQVRVPAGATTVAARGRYLMPGLAEMHAHIPSPQAGEAVIDRTLFLYLAGGVTTVRGMLGHPRHLELREQAARNEILSPRIVTSGPSFNGNSAPTPEVATRMVQEQSAAGYDLLKLHPGLTRPVFDAIVAAADRAGIPYAGHVSLDVGLHRALEARQSSIDHLDGYVEAMVRDGHTFTPQEAGFFGFLLTPHLDESKMADLVARTRAAGVWNVPTQSLLESLALGNAEEMARWPEMRYMPPQTVEQWTRAVRDFQQQPAYTPDMARRFIDVRRRLIRALHDGGAGLLLGSDAPQIMNVPGFAIHRELEYLVASGLTPYQALATGTSAPAVFLGRGQEWGTVEAGRAADLILLAANPLEDIRNSGRIEGVMVRGRWLPADELRQRLDRVAAEVRG